MVVLFRPMIVLMLYIVVSNERQREMAGAGTLAYESFEFFFVFLFFCFVQTTIIASDGPSYFRWAVVA